MHAGDKGVELEGRVSTIEAQGLIEGDDLLEMGLGQLECRDG